jgi:hypothetical protein
MEIRQFINLTICSFSHNWSLLQTFEKVQVTRLVVGAHCYQQTRVILTVRTGGKEITHLHIRFCILVLKLFLLMLMDLVVRSKNFMFITESRQICIVYD